MYYERQRLDLGKEKDQQETKKERGVSACKQIRRQVAISTESNISYKRLSLIVVLAVCVDTGVVDSRYSGVFASMAARGEKSRKDYVGRVEKWSWRRTCAGESGVCVLRIPLTLVGCSFFRRGAAESDREGGGGSAGG